MDYGALQFQDNGVISLGTGVASFHTSGMSSLLQRVFIELVSDPIGRERGAGLAELILRKPLEEQTSAAFASVVRVAEQHIRYLQAGTDQSSLLKSLRLISAQQQGVTWRISIQVESQTGEVAALTPAL